MIIKKFTNNYLALVAISLIFLFASANPNAPNDDAKNDPVS